MAAIIGVIALLLSPSLIWSEYLESPVGLVVIVPFVSIYLFHSIGIPGLLEHAGACGWGWCAPTIFGWFFLFAFWLVVLWVFALFLSEITLCSADKDS